MFDAYTAGETIPHCLKLNNERLCLEKKIYLQDLSSANNLNLQIDGNPTLQDLKNAHEKILSDQKKKQEALNKAKIVVIK